MSCDWQQKFLVHIQTFDVLVERLALDAEIPKGLLISFDRFEDGSETCEALLGEDIDMQG